MPPFTRVSRTEVEHSFPGLKLEDNEWEEFMYELNRARKATHTMGNDKEQLFDNFVFLRQNEVFNHSDNVDIERELSRLIRRKTTMGDAPPKKMEGGDLYNFTKMAHRKFLKHAAVPLFDSLAVALPLAVGHPELVPPALAAAHAGVTATKEAFIPLLGKNKKREAKLQSQQEQEETSRREQEEEDEIMSKYKISGKGIMNQPRSRSVGSDMLSPMAAATMGHSQSMNMKLKLEKDMAMGRRKQMGLIGVSGNLLGPGHIPALQSQPQQNFQFRHTISGAAYHPHVYGNNGLYM